MPRTILVHLVAILLTGATASAGPLKDGEVAWERGHHASALRLFRPLAGQGNATAQLYVGVMHDIGQGTVRDHTLAVKFYREAAEQCGLPAWATNRLRKLERQLRLGPQPMSPGCAELLGDRFYFRDPQIRYWTNLIQREAEDGHQVSERTTAYFNRGEVYRSRGELSHAVADYSVAVGIMDEYPAAHNARGTVYLSRGQYGRAISDFDAALAGDPEFAAAYFNRGKAYDKLAEPQKALSDFDSFARLASADDPNKALAVARAKEIREELASRSLRERQPVDKSWIIQIAATPTWGAAIEVLDKAQASLPYRLRGTVPYTKKITEEYDGIEPAAAGLAALLDPAETNARECSGEEYTDLYLARFFGFSEDNAKAVCRQLIKKKFGCLVVPKETIDLGITNNPDAEAGRGPMSASSSAADLSRGQKAFEACDHALAIQNFRRLAERDNATSQFNLAFMYEGGLGVRQDDSEAVRWYRKAAEQGYATAQVYLGLMYWRGRGVDRDDTKATEWFRKAAEQGDPYGQFHLGVAYESGLGVERDLTRAATWYGRSAAQGHADGLRNLQSMDDEDIGVLSDDAEAFEWYRRAAEQGDAEAQNTLGERYENGIGVARDDAEAVKWYRRAAEQGNADAQFNLGFMYDNGLGVERDYAEAVAWYGQSAAQGNAAAKFNLGIIHDEGLGVPEDDTEAVRWYREAAEQGDAEAQHALADMYFAGDGVAPDGYQAVRWYRAAAGRGYVRQGGLNWAREYLAANRDPAE